jgi:hypothetical protein
MLHRLRFRRFKFWEEDEIGLFLAGLLKGETGVDEVLLDFLTYDDLCQGSTSRLCRGDGFPRQAGPRADRSADSDGGHILQEFAAIHVSVSRVRKMGLAPRSLASFDPGLLCCLRIELLERIG